MKHLISTLFLIVSFFSFTQIDEELENKVIDLETFTEESGELFVSNIYSFVGDDLDSLDIQLMLTRELIGIMTIEKAQNGEKLNYGNVYDRFLETKQSPEYTKYRENTILLIDFIGRPVDLNNWEDDKIVLKKLEFDDEIIESLRLFIIENSDQKLIYNDILEDFFEKQNAKNEEIRKENLHDIHQKFIDIEIFDEEKLLIQSKQENKPILLYFTGFNCVNARKIEQEVLFNSEVADIIMDKFILVPMYVDDRTELPKEMQILIKSKTGLNRSLKTIGDRNSTYQYSRFETSAQPYFVVLNSDNNIIETADYNYKTIEKFTSFLKLSLEKYNKQ